MQDTADKLQVQTYVWTNENDPNLYGDWDFEVNSSSSSSSYVSSIIKFCYPFCIMKWTGYGHELSFNSLPFNLLNWCIEMGDTQSVNFFPVDFLSLQRWQLLLLLLLLFLVLELWNLLEVLLCKMLMSASMCKPVPLDMAALEITGKKKNWSSCFPSL